MPPRMWVTALTPDESPNGWPDWRSSSVIRRLRRLSILITLALRDMRSHLGRTALTAAGISLGVAVVLGVNITNASLLASFNQVFDEAGGKADLTIQDQARGGDGFSEDLLTQVQQRPEVVQAAPLVQTQTLLADELSQWQASTSVTGTLNAGSTLLLMGIDPQLDRSVRQVRITAGRDIEVGESRYSAVLVDDYAEEKELALGDEITVLIPGRQAPERFKVVGLMEKSGMGLINGGAVARIPIEAAQNLMDRQGRYDQIGVVLQDSIAESANQLAATRESLEKDLGEDIRVVYPGARGEELAKRMASYRLGLDLFSTIAMFIGGFLIYNTFAINVAERTRLIGLMRAIGMTRRDVLFQVFIEAALLSVVGSGIGLMMGLGMAQGMSATVGFAAGTEVSSLTIPLNGVIRSLLIGLGVTFVSALWPALDAAGVSPLEALGARAKSGGSNWRRYSWRFGPGLLLVGWLVFNDLPLRESIAWPIVSFSALLFLFGAALSVPIFDRWLAARFRPLIRLPFGSVGDLGAANLERAQSRTLLTVATLMLGIGINIGTVSLGDSFRYDLSRWTEAATGGDLIIQSPVGMGSNVAHRLQSIDGVGLVSAERIVEVWTTGAQHEDEIVFDAIQPETRGEISQFIFEEPSKDAQPVAFRQLLEGGKVLISTSMASRYNLAIGDEITLDTPRGPKPYEVAGVVLDFNGNGLMVYGSWQDLERDFGVRRAGRFLIEVQEGYSAERVSQAIEDQLGDRLNLTVDVVEDLLAVVLEITDRSFVMFDTLALIVVSVSAMGVVNTMAISVMERQREIAMLRSIGMTRQQIRRMILAEAGVIGLLGGVLGLALGLVLSRMFIVVVRHLMDYELSYQLSARALISSVIIALVISQLAALIPAIRAARRPIISSLKEF
ncbi:MAG: ABC transporter permease [Anaerolineales bacterium]